MARQPAKVLRTQRFASRRRDVRRARQRRRRRVTVTVVTLGLLAAGGWMLARSSLFALERIEVAGAKTLTHTDIVRASGLKAGANMLSLDLDAVEARVARLPMVRTVDVTKPAPSRVRILVTERDPAFVLETIHGLYFLDAEAVVLEPASALDPSLPTLRSLSHAPDEAGDRIRTGDVVNAMSLWAALPAALRGGPTLIEVTAGSFTLVRGDLTIKFGPFERIDQKIEAVRLVVDRAKVARERLSTIDVRSPGRPAAVAA